MAAIPPGGGFNVPPSVQRLANMEDRLIQLSTQQKIADSAYNKVSQDNTQAIQSLLGGGQR